jgi:hypothetical protein
MAFFCREGSARKSDGETCGASSGTDLLV